MGPSPRDRWLAAASHLGVPVYGPLLPLAIFFASKGKAFRQQHASRAFTFQCLFLLGWIVLVGLMAVGAIDPVVLLLVLAGVFVVEMPNVIQALLGRPPIHIVPMTILKVDEDRPDRDPPSPPPAAGWV